MKLTDKSEFSIEVTMVKNRIANEESVCYNVLQIKRNKMWDNQTTMEVSIMKKTIVFCLLLGIICLMGCVFNKDEIPQSETTLAIEPTKATSIEESMSLSDTNPSIVETEKWDVIPMIMVDGMLYLDTGVESSVTARCGMLDGEITSSVDGTEVPTENNQSNFGTGFGYQYGALEGTIEIQINGKWFIYATEEVKRNNF